MKDDLRDKIYRWKHRNDDGPIGYACFCCEHYRDECSDPVEHGKQWTYITPENAHEMAALIGESIAYGMAEISVDERFRQPWYKRWLVALQNKGDTNE